MPETTPTGRLTVVLVHGAFADASSWNGVVERLQARGTQVTAPPNPLRGISIDSAYMASVFAQIQGPVLAVGHSYGGAVITNAATNASNVVGLVYVAAFAPDEGETLGAVEAGSKDSVLNPALLAAQYPVAGGGTATELSINPASIREAFAADRSPAPVGDPGCPDWGDRARGPRSSGGTGRRTCVRGDARPAPSTPVTTRRTSNAITPRRRFGQGPHLLAAVARGRT